MNTENESMRYHEWIGNSRTVAWLYILISLALVFYVPRFSTGPFVGSDSYVFGFNNQVAFCLFVGLTAVGSLWWRQFTPGFRAASSPHQVPRRSLYIGLAFGITMCMFMYWLTARLGHYAESTYLINRAEMASRGLRPYLDFEFNYGAAFVYVPVFLSGIFHLSIPNGYYLFWVLNVLVGIWMLYETINRIDIRSEHKSNIFLLLYLFMFPGILSTGVSYTGLRYLSAPLFGLYVFQTIKDRSLRHQLLGSLQTFLLALLLLLISPEISVAFSLGVSAFMFLYYFGSRNRWWILPYASMILFLACLMFVADRVGIFLSLKSFAGGACNFPVVPAAHILMLFITVFLCACFITESIIKRNVESNSLLVILVSLPALAAAMGRCDPGHVVFNVIGLFLVCMLRMSNHPLFWKWYQFAFVIIFLVAGTATGLLLYYNNLSYAVSSLTKEKSWPDASTDAVILPAHLDGPALAPFGYLVDHNPDGLIEGYFFGPTDVFTPKSVARKLDEMANSPVKTLVLPKDFESQCEINPDNSRFLISLLFVYPFRWKAIHTESVYAPLCDYILKNYTLKVPPAADTYNYGIWVKREPWTPDQKTAQSR